MISKNALPLEKGERLQIENRCYNKIKHMNKCSYITLKTKVEKKGKGK